MKLAEKVLFSPLYTEDTGALGSPSPAWGPTTSKSRGQNCMVLNLVCSWINFSIRRPVEGSFLSELCCWVVKGLTYRAARTLRLASSRSSPTPPSASCALYTSTTLPCTHSFCSSLCPWECQQPLFLGTRGWVIKWSLKSLPSNDQWWQNAISIEQLWLIWCYRNMGHKTLFCAFTWVNILFSLYVTSQNPFMSKFGIRSCMSEILFGCSRFGLQYMLTYDKIVFPFKNNKANTYHTFMWTLAHCIRECITS